MPVPAPHAAPAPRSTKEPFDIDEAFRRLRRAVAGYPKAEMLDLRAAVHVPAGRRDQPPLSRPSLSVARGGRFGYIHAEYGHSCTLSLSPGVPTR